MSDDLKDMTHPMQPIGWDEAGVVRFKENALVRFLYEWAQPRGMGLNELCAIPFDAADRAQFAQLIGYSVSGFGDLSYSRAVPGLLDKADEIAAAVCARKKA